MDVEANLICQFCQTKFHTEEDISLHSCIDIEIKQEKRESKIEDPLGVCDSSDLDVSEDDSSSSDVDIGFSFVFGVSGSTSFFVFADDLDDSFSLRTRNNTNFT